MWGGQWGIDMHIRICPKSQSFLKMEAVLRMIKVSLSLGPFLNKEHQCRIPWITHGKCLRISLIFLCCSLRRKEGEMSKK